MPEDRALLLALEAHKESLCPGCSNPKHVAWHSEMDGYYEGAEIVCHSCTAARGEHGGQAVYVIVSNTRDMGQPMPLFVPGETTTRPSTPDK